MTQPLVTFDLAGFRTSHDLTRAELARIFQVSAPQVWRLEKLGKVPMLYIWACRGYAAYQAAKGASDGA